MNVEDFHSGSTSNERNLHHALRKKSRNSSEEKRNYLTRQNRNGSF